MPSFFVISDFCIINPASMGFPLDDIDIKRLGSSYIALFFNIFVPACFPVDNT